MNKARRKWLSDVIDVIEEKKSELESIMDEEQEALVNMPESLQDSERAQEMSDNIDNISSAIESIDDALSNLLDMV